MVDTLNASNNGVGNDDDDGDGGGNGQNGANDNNDDLKCPPPDVSAHDGVPNSDFGAWDKDILNESLDGSRHDARRQSLVRSSKKVIRDKEELRAKVRGRPEAQKEAAGDQARTRQNGRKPHERLGRRR